MGLSERELHESSIEYIVLRLNGYRAKDERDQRTLMALAREICYYAGNGGNFKHGVKKRDIFPLPGETAEERKNSKELDKVLRAATFMNNWTGSEKWKPPHD